MAAEDTESVSDNVAVSEKEEYDSEVHKAEIRTVLSTDNEFDSPSIQREDLLETDTGDSCTESFDESDCSLAATSRVEKALRNLNFHNPGPRFEYPLPSIGDGKRRSRRINDSSYTQLRKQKAIYDAAGRIAQDGRDLCDCLCETCPGCHLPCPGCTSTKCGPECRVNRNAYYDQLEVEGTNIVVFNTWIPETSK